MRQRLPNPETVRVLGRGRVLGEGAAYETLSAILDSSHEAAAGRKSTPVKANCRTTLLTLPDSEDDVVGASQGDGGGPRDYRACLGEAAPHRALNFLHRHTHRHNPLAPSWEIWHEFVKQPTLSGTEPIP